MTEIRFALRQLVRNAGFAVVAALTLGLGIALVSVQFSLIDGVFLRPLPFPEAERLVHVARQGEAFGSSRWDPLPADEFVALRDQQTVFSGLAGFQFVNLNMVQGERPPRRLIGQSVTSNFFELLRTPPLLGRGFVAGEDRLGQALSAVISHSVWQDEFAADPNIIGRPITLNGEAGTVVGVMPAGFGFPNREECWVNLRLPEQLHGLTPMPRLEAMGLLLPQVDPAQAQTQLQPLVERVNKARAKPADTSSVITIDRFQIAYNGPVVRSLLGTMLAMTLLVLALACVNVANLLFVRAADRTRELALRDALGAGRSRIVRQLLVESLLLATLGAGCGLILAALGVYALDSVAARTLQLPTWIHFDMNSRVLLFAATLAVLAGSLAGLLPALRASRTDLNASLRSGGRTATLRQRSGRWMICGQIAFAGCTMITAVLLSASAVRSSQANHGFAPESLLIGRIELQSPSYNEASARVRFYDELLARLQATPGVAAAAVSSRDLAGEAVFSAVEIEGTHYARDIDRPSVWLEVVSRDYFEVVDQPALSGRVFNRSDSGESLPVALVNRSLAQKLWPGLDPIGQRLKVDQPDARWAQIIGVVPDMAMQGVGNGMPGAGLYLLQEQIGWGWLDLLVRVQGDPTAMIDPVRRAVAAIDPAQPIHAINTLTERTERRVAPLQLIGAMSAVFAGCALLLAAVGIYGVMAFAARRRTRELGVRMALGSTRPMLLLLLLRGNAVQSLLGIGLGIALGFALSRPLAPLLPQVAADEAWIYLAVAGLLGVTTLLACWWPARQAAQADPVTALRSD